MPRQGSSCSVRSPRSNCIQRDKVHSCSQRPQQPTHWLDRLGRQCTWASQAGPSTAPAHSRCIGPDRESGTCQYGTRRSYWLPQSTSPRCKYTGMRPIGCHRCVTPCKIHRADTDGSRTHPHQWRSCHRAGYSCRRGAASGQADKTRQQSRRHSCSGRRSWERQRRTKSLRRWRRSRTGC